MAAMFAAWFGAIAAFIALQVARGEPWSGLNTIIIGAFAGIAGFGVVLPVLMLAPSLRRLPYWLAASWGAGIASLCVSIPIWMRTGVFSAPIGIVLMSASVGVSAGVTYAIAARVLMRFQRRV
jgi:hypothetical protein